MNNAPIYPVEKKQYPGRVPHVLRFLGGLDDLKKAEYLAKFPAEFAALLPEYKVPADTDEQITLPMHGETPTRASVAARLTQSYHNRIGTSPGTLETEPYIDAVVAAVREAPVFRDHDPEYVAIRLIDIVQSSWLDGYSNERR